MRSGDDAIRVATKAGVPIRRLVELTGFVCDRRAGVGQRRFGVALLLMDADCQHPGLVSEIRNIPEGGDGVTVRTVYRCAVCGRFDHSTEYTHWYARNC